MKNTYIALILVVLVGLALFLGFRGKNLEAPSEIGSKQENNTENMPYLEGETDGENTEADTILETNLNAEVKTEGKVEANTTKEFNVSGENFSFKPNLITVKKGDRVKITFKNSAGFHDFVIDEYGMATKKTQAPTTEVLEFTADKVGSFEYYCSVGSHKAMGMYGTLKVE